MNSFSLKNVSTAINHKIHVDILNKTGQRQMVYNLTHRKSHDTQKDNTFKAFMAQNGRLSFGEHIMSYI
jgi:hypothetical protein